MTNIKHAWSDIGDPELRRHVKVMARITSWGERSAIDRDLNNKH